MPTIDDYRDRLHRAGWAFDETATGSGWLVRAGQGRRDYLHAEGQTQAEALWRVCIQAGELGEEDWLNGDDPGPMLGFLRKEMSHRKARLLACACCRRIWGLLPAEECRQAIRVAELVADGRLDAVAAQASIDAAVGRYWVQYRGADGPASHLTRAAAAVMRTVVWPHNDGEYVRLRGWYGPALAHVANAAHAAEQAITAAAGCPAVRRVNVAVPELLRCLFGNPFRPLPLSPSWRTPDVMALASTIYEEHAFADLPALADAMEDAGCMDESLLAHLRGPGQHARGCHVLDAILDLG